MIGEALRRGANRQATLRTFSGADHGIFVHEDGFRKAQDYERGTLQLAPGFTTTMVDWVSARGRGEPAERRDDRPLRPPERVWEVDARPWHESPAVHLAVGSLLAATFTGTVAARIGVWLLRRARRHRPPELSASVRRARSLAMAVAVGGSVLMTGLVLRLAAFILGAPLPAARAALLAAGMATAALAVAFVVCTVRAWSEPWPGRARLAHGALAAAAVVLVPFAGYWRLLG